MPLLDELLDGNIDIGIGGGIDIGGGSGTGSDPETSTGTETETETGTETETETETGTETETETGTETETETGTETETETETETGTETETETETDGRVSPSSGTDHKQVSFQIINGQVVSVSEYDNGELKPLSINSNEFYATEGQDVIHTKIMAFGVQVTRYKDSDQDGYFTRDSELWTTTLEGVQSGAILPVITQSLTFNPTSGNDNLAVRQGESTLGGTGSDNFIFREAGHLRIGDFHSSEGDMLVFDTALGLTSKEHLESFVTGLAYDADNLIISFGPAVSITLIGVDPGEISWNDVSVLS